MNSLIDNEVVVLQHPSGFLKVWKALQQGRNPCVVKSMGIARFSARTTLRSQLQKFMTLGGIGLNFNASSPIYFGALEVAF